MIPLSVHVYPSPFEHETRILKITRTLVDRGIAERVVIIATAKDGLPERQNLDARRVVWRVATLLQGRGLIRKSMMFIEWSWRVIGNLRAEPVRFVNCHSLSSLPLCVALTWWHRAVLIYEPHELETETATSTGIRRKISKVLERRLIKFASAVYVVSRSIADHYQRDYGLAAVPFVLNAPDPEPDSNAMTSRCLRDLFDIPENHIVFMYQGMLAEARGVRLLLDAFDDVPQDRHLIVMGFGPLETEIREYSRRRPNVHLHAAVPPAEVIEATRSADVGFALLEDSCINHRCALPNKFFHYLHAGVPVVASDLPEMGALIEQYQCGWRVANTRTALCDLIRRIDRSAIEQRRLGVAAARGDLTWQRESEKLVALYATLHS